MLDRQIERHKAREAGRQAGSVACMARKGERKAEKEMIDGEREKEQSAKADGSSSSSRMVQ